MDTEKRVPEQTRERPPRSSDSAASPIRLTAIQLPSSGAAMTIIAAPRHRKWFTGNFGKAAKRCLPLMVANQAGWLLLNPMTFDATWNGSETRESVTLAFDARPPRPKPVVEAFGNGVISWRIPYIFRTDPGWSLLARGPANYFKDGAAPLEGLVETDWAESTFTMNWKITRPDHPIRFQAGEPVCMIVPQRRRDLMDVVPTVTTLSHHPELAGHYTAWELNRREQQIRDFLRSEGRAPDDEHVPESLQYFRGIRGDGIRAQAHLTRLSLREFRPESGTDEAGRP